MERITLKTIKNTGPTNPEDNAAEIGSQAFTSAFGAAQSANQNNETTTNGDDKNGDDQNGDDQNGDDQNGNENNDSSTNNDTSQQDKEAGEDKKDGKAFKETKVGKGLGKIGKFIAFWKKDK